MEVELVETVYILNAWQNSKVKEYKSNCNLDETTLIQFADLKIREII